MVTKWRLAESLKTLRKQLDARFPRRSKVSDGSVGDQSHASRASDHNPNRAGVVTAIDITHDPANGVDCHKLAASLTAANDPRVKYLIWNARITQKTNPTAWKAYTGSNKHTKHLHISVKSDPALYDSSAPWGLSILKPVAAGEASSKVVSTKPSKLQDAVAARGAHAAQEGQQDNDSAQHSTDVAQVAPQTSVDAARLAKESIERLGRQMREETPASAKTDDTTHIPAIPPLPVSLPAAAKWLLGLIAGGTVGSGSVATFATFLQGHAQLVASATTVLKWGFIAFAQVATVAVIGLLVQRMWNAKLANDLNIVRLSHHADDTTPNVDFKGWKDTAEMKGA